MILIDRLRIVVLDVPLEAYLKKKKIHIVFNV